MLNKDATKEQLLKEIDQLKAKISEFEKSENHSKQTISELRGSEEKYRFLFEGSNDGIILADDNINILDVNSAYTRITGVPKEDIIGKSAFSLARKHINIKQLPQVLSILKKAIQKIPVKKFELLINDKIIEVSTDGNNKVQRVGAIRDITEKSRFEKEIIEAKEKTEESEKKYRNMVELSPEGICLMNLSGRITEINKAFTEITGFAADEIVGKHATKLPTKPKPANSTISNLFRNAISGKKIEKIEFKWTHKNGEIRDGEARAKLLKIENTFNNVLIIIEDTTKRKRTEQELKQSEERYKGIIQNTSNCIAVYNAVDYGNDFVFVDFNPSAEKVENISKEKVIGKKVTEVFSGVKEFGLFDVFQKVWKTGKPQHFPVLFYKDNSISGYRENYVYKLSSGEIVAVYYDLTEQKKAEEKIVEFQKKLSELNTHNDDLREQERKKIARDLHDDLGQMLTALNMELAVLKNKLPKDNSRINEIVDSMGNIINGCGETIRDIASDLRPSILDNLGLIAAIKWQAKKFKTSTGIICKVELPPEEFSINPKLSINIFRIIQEALINIVKHAQASEVIIRIKERKNALELNIIDNGIGIDKMEISNFRSFGLLGISERAKSCKGDFEISEKNGGGTILSIILPYTKTDKAND